MESFRSVISLGMAISLLFGLVQGTCDTLPTTTALDGAIAEHAILVGMDDLTIASEIQSYSYAAGDRLIYECANKMRFVIVECQDDDTWAEPARRCDEQPPLGSGGAGGITLAAINVAIAVFLMVYSSIRVVCSSGEVVPENVMLTMKISS